MVTGHDLSRIRDAEYFEFYDRHPHTINQTVRSKIFGSYKVAARRFVRLKKRKRGRKPRIVGTVLLHESGRAAHVYCAWRPASLLHEVLLTDELIGLPIPLQLWLRGGRTDRSLRPDAEIPNVLMVEFDSGTERRKQVQKQARAYSHSSIKTLWIVPDVRRMDWIRQVANLDTTLMMLHGGQEVWDLTGRSVSVDKFCRHILSSNPGS